MANQWTTMLVEFYNEKEIEKSKVSDYQTIIDKFYILTVIKKDLSFEDAQKNPSEFIRKIETYFSERSDYYEICCDTLSWLFFKEKLNEYICQHKNPWVTMLEKFLNERDSKNIVDIYGDYYYNVIIRNFFILTVKKDLSFEDAQKNPSEFIKKVETYFSSENPEIYTIYCSSKVTWSLFKKELNEYLCQNNN